MAFVVEDGTGLVSANSYTSVAEARSYWSDVGTTFLQADLILQTALVAATRYIETRFRNRFKGYREFPPTEDPAFAGQALSFPRLCLYDHEGYALTGVPLRIRQATAEYMKRALEAENVLAPDPDGAPNVIREKIGPLETEFMPGSIPLFKPYPTADALISMFINSGNYCYR